MTVFVDTAALFALVDRDDDNHEAAVGWIEQSTTVEHLVTHRFVVVESVALVQRRIGVTAVRYVVDSLLPDISIEDVGGSAFAGALRLHADTSARGVSIVDRISFEFMRSAGLASAFTFDSGFADEGFMTLP